MNDFIDTLKSENSNSQINYSIGNLDDDNIPELAIFIGKNPEDEEDEGSLEVYKFDGEKYALMDSVSMNFDASNYQIEIGNLSKEKSGILLNNDVGKRSGMTYGFILKDDKIKSILNSKKLNLVSILTQNQIKDIDNDGILEFSIYTIDPETEDVTIDGSDKMTIWYKWDGKDSADILKVERKELSKDSSDKKLYNQINQSINDDFPNFINLLLANKEKLSNYDNTSLLNKYIDKLESLSYSKSLRIENLFIKNQENKDIDPISDKYEIDINDLNNLEYLNREKVLGDAIEIKEDLMRNINLGYQLSNKEESYYYSVDYKKLSSLFEDNITREYRDYLQIISVNSNQKSSDKGSIDTLDGKLIDRILLLESFKIIYPFSDWYEEVNSIYKSYIYIYLYGDNKPNFDIETGKIKDSTFEKFQNTISEYPSTNFTDIIREFLNSLEKNSFMLNDTIRIELENRLE